jgi:sulfopyruvate decarboxylase TPP-binding subunit
MEIKLGEIVNAKDSLIKLFKMDLPIIISYKLGKLVKEVDKEIKHFEEERFKLIKKYGELTDKNSYSVKPENVEEFAKDLKELLEISLKLEIEKVSLENISSEIKLSAIDLVSLEKFVDLEAKK